MLRSSLAGLRYYRSFPEFSGSARRPGSHNRYPESYQHEVHPICSLKEASGTGRGRLRAASKKFLNTLSEAEEIPVIPVLFSSPYAASTNF